MNWCEIQGNWSQMQRLLQSYWSMLSEEDLAAVDARRERLALVLQRRYGFNREQTEHAICRFEHDVRRPGAVK